MLTAEMTDADNTAHPPRSVMMTISEIADRDGVSKQVVSRSVKLLRAAGLFVELDRLGRVAAVNSVQYDELRRRYADPSKTQAPKLPTSTSSESYDEALRQKTWTEAERARLRLAEEKGQLVRVDRLTSALSVAGEKIIRSVDLVLNDADDLAAAVAKEGTAGLRAALKKIAFRLRSEMADALSGVVADPADDGRDQEEDDDAT